MTAKDGKNDPQDTNTLFPMTTDERQRQYKRIAENLRETIRLKEKLAGDGRPVKAAIKQLADQNVALLRELDTK